MTYVEKYLQLQNSLPKEVLLVVVSKNQPAEKIAALYEAGCRDFGENKVQELLIKQEQLAALGIAKEIRWHFIGNLQRNKVKYIVGKVYCIHSVSRFELLEALETQAQKAGVVQKVLLEFHIGASQTKQGFALQAFQNLLQANPNYFHNYSALEICGVMGMADFSEDTLRTKQSFAHLKAQFNSLKAYVSSKNFQLISMGMSADYTYALAEGSTCIRLGSSIFQQDDV